MIGILSLGQMGKEAQTRVRKISRKSVKISFLLCVCVCSEGEGSDCSLPEGRQLLIASAAQALWVPAKSGHRNILLIINQSKADCVEGIDLMPLVCWTQ